MLQVWVYAYMHATLKFASFTDEFKCSQTWQTTREMSVRLRVYRNCIYYLVSGVKSSDSYWMDLYLFQTSLSG